MKVGGFSFMLVDGCMHRRHDWDGESNWLHPQRMVKVDWEMLHGLPNL